MDTSKTKGRPKENDFDGDSESSLMEQITPGAEIKLVLLVNGELKMGKGKIAAQCGHAVSILMKRLMTSRRALLKAWEQCGQPKVALKVSTKVELDALASQAEGAGLLVCRVLDAGRTQVAAGSNTVVSIGPAENARIDRLTSHLSLL